MSKNVGVLLENQSLKKEFEIRNLDLSQVFTFAPDDLEDENERLKYLLEWVQKYSELRSRKIMEKDGYEYPPISFCITPDNDWSIFEKWLKGIPIRTSIKKLLPPNFDLKRPDELNDEEVEIELKKLKEAIISTNFNIVLNDGIPSRLIYEYLLEMICDDYEMLVEGAWTLDGCTGGCPECFQRPWCEQGGKSCHKEDEEAGEMFLIESVKRFVSASPVSLKILQICREEEKDKFKEFEKNSKDQDEDLNDILYKPGSFNLDDDGIPY